MAYHPIRQRTLLFGGYDGSNRVNDFHKFDFKRQKWSQINTATTPS